MRLGHLNFKGLKEMGHKKMVQGVPDIDHPNHLCESCLLGKHSRKPFPETSEFKTCKATWPGVLIYMWTYQTSITW